MRVYVTGIAGFLGSHLADALLNSGHEVAGNDNLIGGTIENVPEAASFHEIDCSNFESMREAMQGFDVVVHTACTAYEGLSVFSPVLVGQNTYQASVSTFTAGISAGVSRVVNCSSMARYGMQETLPMHEAQSPDPVDPYGIAKLAAEKTLEALAEVHQIEWTTLVPHNIVGPRQRFDDPYRNVVAIMINRCLQGKPPVIYGDGNQQRSFSDIRDVIDPFVEAVTSPAVVREVINIGPDHNEVSINELAGLVLEVCQFDARPIYLADRPLEVKRAFCSADKARKFLGYEQHYDLRETVEYMYEWIREVGPRDFRYDLRLELQNSAAPETWTRKSM